MELVTEGFGGYGFPNVIMQERNSLRVIFLR